MSDLKTLSDRIDALEARLMFQDETIETLNKTITEQWLKIDALTRQIAGFGERLEEAAELVVHRVGVQVNDDDVAGWMDADRQTIGEVANPSLIALTDAQMRGVVG